MSFLEGAHLVVLKAPANSKIHFNVGAIFLPLNYIEGNVHLLVEEKLVLETGYKH